MTKLSQPMIVALHEIHAKTIKSNITVKSQTLTALDKRGLITEGEYVGEPALFLTNAGKEAIGVKSDGDFTPENIARAMEDINAESVEEGDEVSAFQHLVNEGVYHPAPFSLNRAARRASRRNQARMGRVIMKAHGKRIKKYGILMDPEYVARKLAA